MAGSGGGVTLFAGGVASCPARGGVGPCGRAEDGRRFEGRNPSTGQCKICSTRGGCFHPVGRNLGER
jgi:hypothetical protein